MVVYSCEILTRCVAMMVGLAVQILAVVHLVISKDKQVIILLIAVCNITLYAEEVMLIHARPLPPSPSFSWKP